MEARTAKRVELIGLEAAFRPNGDRDGCAERSVPDRFAGRVEHETGAVRRDACERPLESRLGLAHRRQPRGMRLNQRRLHAGAYPLAEHVALATRGDAA